jgi:hypothetical protein
MVLSVVAVRVHAALTLARSLPLPEVSVPGGRLRHVLSSRYRVRSKRRRTSRNSQPKKEAGDRRELDVQLAEGPTLQ